MNPADDTQLSYARTLDWAAKLGFLLLLATFAIYLTGLLSPHVPLEDLPRYWSLPASHYLKAAQVPTGWAWLWELHHGDFLNFGPIAILAAVAIWGYLGVGYKFFRQGEMVMGIIVILEIMVLTLAASGIFQMGGH